MGHFNFWLSLSLSDSLSKTLSWTLKCGLRPKFNKVRKFGLNLSLSEITSLFDLSLYLDRTWAQRKAQWKAKSKVKVAQCLGKIDLLNLAKLSGSGGIFTEPDFCWIWKKCWIPAGAGAEIRYSPSSQEFTCNKHARRAVCRKLCFTRCIFACCNSSSSIDQAAAVHTDQLLLPVSATAKPSLAIAPVATLPPRIDMEAARRCVDLSLRRSRLCARPLPLPLLASHRRQLRLGSPASTVTGQVPPDRQPSAHSSRPSHRLHHRTRRSCSIKVIFSLFLLVRCLRSDLPFWML